jgi:alpha-ketoglutarate-dependent taurine dioxygenase
LRQLGETLGTEALGIDLAQLDDETFAWIRRVFTEHPVLVFREQSSTPATLPPSAGASTFRASTP